MLNGTATPGHTGHTTVACHAIVSDGECFAGITKNNGLMCKGAGHTYRVNGYIVCVCATCGVLVLIDIFRLAAGFLNHMCGAFGGAGGGVDFVSTLR